MESHPDLCDLRGRGSSLDSQPVHRAAAAELPSWLPHKQVALGLDLRGGSYLLLEVDVAAAERDRLNSVEESVRNALRDAKIGYTGLSNQGNAVVFTIRDPAQIATARQVLGRIDNDLTVEIAADGAGTIRFRQAALEARRRQAVEQSIEIIRRRIDETGTKEPTIQRQGQDRILVQLPGVDNPEHVKTLLGRTAKLTFQLVDTSANPEEARRGRLPPGDEILPAKEERGSVGRGSMSCASASWSAATCWSTHKPRSTTTSRSSASSSIRSAPGASATRRARMSASRSRSCSTIR